MPVRKDETVTEEDILQALTSQNPVTTKEDIFQATETSKSDPNDQGTIQHTTHSKVRVFKRMNNGHWAPRLIPRQNLTSALKNGFRASCPECGSNTCTGRPNECSGQMNIKFRRCPQCGKKIHDDPVIYASQFMGKSGNSEEEEIQDDAYEASTPESRTKAFLDRHILAYHPAEAGFLGVAVTDPRRANNV